jgi:hypothetical protein
MARLTAPETPPDPDPIGWSGSFGPEVPRFGDFRGLSGSAYLCAHPGCTRLTLGWLCELHRQSAGLQRPGRGYRGLEAKQADTVSHPSHVDVTCVLRTT